ncbi:MAG: type I phosphomannose isomerase catalytic subunit [Acutalibacteraceae bacterium]|nr:type I phosphomannose isomerase catalytic subunit [Acutalibacteraceae bacterium]
MSEILRLSPAFKDYLWGGQILKEKYNITDMDKVAESWVFSTHKDGQSVVKGGSLDGKTLSEAVEILGEAALGKKAAEFEMFPQMVKIIDAEQSLSIQVHPSDEYALANEGQYGKTEMWYILGAKEGAGIYYGVKSEITQNQLKEAIENNTIEDVLCFQPCKAGESYFIPSGTIHAIGAGLLIAEVQQNSNVTYRVYDFGRVGADGKPRELHTEKAVRVSNLTPMTQEKIKTAEKVENGSKTLLSTCSYFEALKIEIDGEYSFAPSFSFVCVFIIDGSGEINGEPFGQFDTFFVPADMGKVTLNGSFTAILSHTPGK